MKKIILLISLVFTFYFSTCFSACPSGYIAGQPVTFTPEGWSGCTLTVRWCYIAVDPPLITCADIFIEGWTINGNCTINVSYPIGITPPTIDEFLSGLAQYSQEFRDAIALFPLMDLKPCDGVWNGGYGEQCRIYTGACYHHVPSEDPLIQIYQICNPELWGQCKEYYRFCRRLINGNWVRSVFSTGEPDAMFNCTTPCFPKCQ